MGFPDNCHPRGVVGREHIPTLHVFVLSAVKVNALLKNEFEVPLKMASFFVRSHTSFLALHMLSYFIACLQPTCKGAEP